MGSRVEVTIVAEEPRGLLASFQGELSAGGEIEHVPYPVGNEAFVFRLDGGTDSSFVLENRMLRQAFLLDFSDDRPDSLRFYLGVSTVLQVDPLEDPEAAD